MVDQGRLAKVIFSLMAAMTGGALLLLALEGKPIKPMAYSLSSQTELTGLNDALGLEAGIDPAPWNRIEITYRANDGQLSDEYDLTGKLAMQYHFVVSDGSAGADGHVFTSPRWNRQLPCLPLDDIDARRVIKMCIIADPASPYQTPSQARNLENLVDRLRRQCHVDAGIVWTD